MPGILIYVCLGLTAFLALAQIVLRIVRHFYKFPIPAFMVGIIDNPLRRKIQSPASIPARHGLAPGMVALEVGPGNGAYTAAAARAVGPTGRIVAIDIEPKVIEGVKGRAKAEGIANIEARVADVFALPFEDGTFDAVTMMAVIGEIPTREKAIPEFYRVLKPTGTLVFTEIVTDPDYPRARTLIRLVEPAGFRLRRKMGGFFYYTLIFEKKGAAQSA